MDAGTGFSAWEGKRRSAPAFAGFEFAGFEFAGFGEENF